MLDDDFRLRGAPIEASTSTLVRAGLFPRRGYKRPDRGWMKLTVLVPSDVYKSYAGARIRYGRLAPALAHRGIDMVLEEIGHFDPKRSDCDALVISKCHDAASLVAAAACSALGKLVGIDLFDDYFSNEADSRLLRYRSWLHEVSQNCDFALCSTEVMLDVASRYRPDLPIHIVNDPAPSGDIRQVSELAATKLDELRDSDCLRIGWFGVGDNPLFPVGLQDLAAFGSVLGQLRRSGMTVDLTVLTNRRALGANGLSLIQQLPINAKAQEWNERAEADLLRHAFAIFLPVNSQPFSAAKSLNRAVTALSAGCQVLSVGYPLYRSLEPLIYREATEMLADIQRGVLRLSTARMVQYKGKLQSLASPEREAEKLAEFLASLPIRAPGPMPPITVIHGHNTRTETHMLVRSLAGLSVASPYCAAPLDFDVIFRTTGSGDLEMLVSRELTHRLVSAAKFRVSRAEVVRGHSYRVLATADRSAYRGRVNEADPIALQMASYKSLVSEIARQMAVAFGPSRTIVSENSHLPFPSLAFAE